MAVKTILVFSAFMVQLSSPLTVDGSIRRCGTDKKGNSNVVKRLKYVYGDALLDSRDCIGPEGVPYPSYEIDELISGLKNDVRDTLFTSSRRQGRTLFEKEHISAEAMRRRLIGAASRPEDSVLSFAEAVEAGKRRRERRDTETTSKKEASKSAADKSSNGYPSEGDDDDQNDDDDAEDDTAVTVCNPDNKTPSRLCKTTYNTTAPMYGVSLTSGEPVTIVQKFPDLLQQVVYEICDRKECDLVHGECVQTYIPYLFLVIPLGPVTLTGQDYVLVESGCTCRPKYANKDDPDPLSVIPNFHA